MGRVSRSALVLGVAVLVLAGGGAYALASSLSGGTITVCVHHKGGTLYKARTCAKHDKKLSWNKQGPAGATGATGPKGAIGATGATGTQGPPGPATGPAGGALAGSYPNPSLASGSVTSSALAQMPAARIEDTCGALAFSVSSGTATAMRFFLADFDQGGLFNGPTCYTAASTLTAPQAGLYVITAGIAWPSNATGYREISLQLNGATTLAADQRPAVNGADTEQSVSTIYRLAADDNIEEIVTQTSGGTLYPTSDERSYLAMTFLSP